MGSCWILGPERGIGVHLYPNLIKGDGGVTKIYGVEPNLEQHASLRRKVRESGLEGVYEIVGAGAEELGGLGLGIEEEGVIRLSRSRCCAVCRGRRGW
jgi:hypothetical protein